MLLVGLDDGGVATCFGHSANKAPRVVPVLTLANLIGQPVHLDRIFAGNAGIQEGRHEDDKEGKDRFHVSIIAHKTLVCQPSHITPQLKH